MRMRFIGPKVSLGYVPQAVYSIQVELTHAAGKAMIVVSSPNHMPCPYASMEAFLENWSKD